jgi:hypothetical protein
MGFRWHNEVLNEVSMNAIELTDEQRRVLERERGKPVDVIDPATQQRYVLLAQEQFARIRSLLEESSPPLPESCSQIPPGILQSQKAFWQDLPKLLKEKWNQGKWVCYHGQERVGIGTSEELIRACIDRGIADDAYHLDLIEAQSIPPWEDVEVERFHPHVFEELPPEP